MITPKIEMDRFFGSIVIDVQTQPKKGGSSAKVLNTEDTEVYFGHLHARVEMRDLHIVVFMDPEPGQWANREWARSRALSVLCAPETIILVLPRLAELCMEAGRKAGRDEIRHEMCVLLGVRS